MRPNHGDAGNEKLAGSICGNDILDSTIDARGTNQPHDSRLYERQDPSSDPPSFKPDFRLYVIVFGLGVANLLAALENTVIVVAAPVILTELRLGDNFIWITNAFFLCSTALQPLFGQCCNIFGRRYVMLAVIGIFMLGSGICGGSTTGGMLIAGRAIQGAGSGGIIMASSTILSDLVPLRQRGTFSAILMAIFGVGSAVGPFIGGAIVSTTTWRWVFYLNLPIGTAALIILFVFLRVKHNNEMTLREKLQRIDLFSNLILMASTVAILYALSYAGTRYPWQAWHTLVPLFIGFAGLVLFGWLQTTNWLTEVLMPPRFFSNRTSIILAINTFLSSALLYWCLFFLPVFFQGVKLYSPQRTGVALLPISLLGIPGSMIGAVVLTRWGRYKYIHIVAFALQTLGFGLFTIQYEGTSIGQWVISQCITSLGGGMLFSTMLPAFQAFIPEHDLATCTAVWYFIRLFGHIWGVAIPAAIFNDRINQLLSHGAVSEPEIARNLSSGHGYQAASANFVAQFSTGLQSEIRAVLRISTQRVFQVAIVFAGVGFVLALFEKEIELRRTIETKFGLEAEAKHNGKEDEMVNNAK